MISFQGMTLILAATLTVVAASPVIIGRSGYSVKESHLVPPGWSNIGTAPPDHILNVQIGLTQYKIQELERNLYQGMKIGPIWFAVPGISCEY